MKHIKMFESFQDSGKSLVAFYTDVDLGVGVLPSEEAFTLYEEIKRSKIATDEVQILPLEPGKDIAIVGYGASDLSAVRSSEYDGQIIDKNNPTYDFNEGETGVAFYIPDLPQNGFAVIDKIGEVHNYTVDDVRRMFY